MIDQANIDQYTQRISDQQATIERLIAREIVLHNALSAAVERIVNQFGVGYDATDIDMWEAALADPSPAAEALAAVVKEAIAVSEKRNEFGGARLGLTALDSSVDAYLAVTRGADAGTE